MIVLLKRLEMLKNKKFRKRLLYTFLIFTGLLVSGFIWLAVIAHVNPPKPPDISSLQLKRSEPSPGLYTINKNWFRKSNSGLYELYVEGKPYERGVINGKLTEELVQRQEDHFNDQINKMIPSA